MSLARSLGYPANSMQDNGGNSRINHHALDVVVIGYMEQSSFMHVDNTKKMFITAHETKAGR